MGFAKNAMMAADEDGYWPSDKSICPAHLNDSYLRALVERNLDEETCSYCGASREGTEEPVAAPLDVVLSVFISAASRFYERADGPIEFDGETIVKSRDADDVLDDLMPPGDGYVDEIRGDMAEAMRDTLWLPANWARLAPDEVLLYSWDAFQEVVKHQSRYFFSDFVDPVDDERLSPRALFARIAESAARDEGMFYAPCPTLYRARAFAEEPGVAEYGCAAQLGAPPSTHAAANRMSPAGISMFYGATDPATAIAEVTAHSPHKHVLVGEFAGLRELRLLNLTRIPDVPSPFDPALVDCFFMTRFLQRFVADLIKPVELDGREHIEYVPTQVFTEYIRQSFPARLDGMIFPSAQGAGSNVVLFYDNEFVKDEGEADDYTRLVLVSGSVEKHAIA